MNLPLLGSMEAQFYLKPPILFLGWAWGHEYQRAFGGGIELPWSGSVHALISLWWRQAVSCSTTWAVCTLITSGPRRCICRGAALEQSHRGNLGWKGHFESISSNICLKQAGTYLFSDHSIIQRFPFHRAHLTPITSKTKMTLWLWCRGILHLLSQVFTNLWLLP